jgi:hypothetical protein
MFPGFTSRWTSPAACAASSASADLGDEGHCARRLQPSFAAQELAKVRSVDVGEREVEPAVLLARGDRPDDVRVVERGRQLRLAEETAPEALVARQRGLEELERDPPPGLVLGKEDRAHRAAADLRPDTEAGQHAPGRRGHGHRSCQA